MQMDKVRDQIKAIETELLSLHEDLDRIDYTHYASYTALMAKIAAKTKELQAMRKLILVAG